MESDEGDIFEQCDNYLIERDILLRKYQLSLLEKAKKGNTVLYLPTGAGKTLIAVHVLCSKTDEIIGSFQGKGKKAFFVATTQIMVFQLMKVLKTHTKFKVAFYIGSMNVDAWNRQKWEAQFNDFHVFVLTAEILRLILELQFIEPKDICLIVFDECHHAVYDHPYRLIIDNVHKVESSEAPLLLGLSAVLLNCSPKPSQVLSKIQYLENLFKGKVITETVELREVTSFSTDPEEKIIIYRENDSTIPESILHLYDSTISALRKMKIEAFKNLKIPETGKLFGNENKAKRIANGIIQARKHVIEMGPFGGFLSALFFTILFEKYRLLSDDPLEIAAIVYANTELNKIRHGLQKIIGDEERANAIFLASSQKIQEFLNLLLNIHKSANGKHVSILVFVHQRSTAVVLAFLLKRLSAFDRNFDFVKAEFITSSTVQNPSTFYSKHDNEEIIKQFVSRSLNLLVATNLLEEGIDIPSCNVVISFDFPLGYPNYFQTKGRARAQKSTYYMFVKESEKELKSNALLGFREIKENLFKKVSQDDFYSDDEIMDSMSSIEKITLFGKSRTINVDGVTAIKVVDRYCSKLPQDKFSLLSPMAWYIVVADKKKAFVQLPVNCPLNDVVEGNLRDNSKLAKRSAFLATVRRLFEMKELDDNLLPRSFKLNEKDFDYLFPHYKNEKIDKNLPQPGTRKRRQMYKMKYSESLSNCLPRPGVKAYVHVIDLTLAFAKPELDRRIGIYDVLRSPVTFAIISSKKLRKIFQFPLFIQLGQINCDFVVNYEEIVLTEAEINDIKAFHFAVFKKILKILKDTHIFDNRFKEHSFFIAPVEKNDEDRFVLQWDVIRCDFCRINNSAVVGYNPSSNRKLKRIKIKDYFINAINISSGEELKTSTSLVPVDTISGRLLWSINEVKNNPEPKFTVTEANYEYFVLRPNYRYQDFSHNYIVSQVCRNMSPLSPFPNEKFPDYASYYQERYGIQVTNSNQPLLKVSPIGSCSNFNKPRERKIRRAKDRFKEFEEHLIPELCDIFPFDRRFWVKAILLPTVLNRLYHVYFVEEFRRKIVSETNLGLLELPEGMSWKPLMNKIVFTDEDVEDETGLSVGSCVLGLKSFLPLSTLKDKAQANQKVILSPERHLCEVGLCDLEFYVKRMKESVANDEYEKHLAREILKENNFIIQLKNLRSFSAPTLNILNCSRNSFGPDLNLLVQVSTSKSANDIVNYERLEFLGDSFLKFAAALFLFRNYSENEGILTAVKGKIVGNRNLLYCGLEKGIQDVINVNDFVPLSDWNPPLFCVPEKLVEDIIVNNVDPAVLSRFEFSVEEQFSGILSEESIKKNQEILETYEKCYETISNSILPYKTVEDKTISDCVEAFIGAYLLTLGLRGAFEFLMWLGVLPRPNGSYSELIEKPLPVRCRKFDEMPTIMSLLEKVFYVDLEDTLNYRFQNKALLLEALTHPSYIQNRVTDCYQRLEFLGDAILDFLITTYVYENCGELTPGHMTDIRSSLVNNVTLACLVVRYELYKHLLSFSTSLSKAIGEFVSFQINRNHEIDENVLILLEENDSFIAETIQVPKALGDMFESLAGAIYLDSGNSLETVWKVYYRLMKRELDEFTKNVPKSAVKLLQEICGNRLYYETKTVDDRVKVSCTIYYENQEIKTHGFGKNKIEGKRSAAKLALNQIIAMKK